MAGLAINTGAFLFVVLLEPGDFLLYGLIVFVSGAGLGANLAIPPAMQADVVAWAEHSSGEAQEGRYVGLWSLARKVAAAASAAFALSVVGFFGYEAGAIEQRSSSLFALQYTYAIVPCLLNAAGIFVLSRYQLSKSQLEAIE